jgi:predicted deacylase
MQESIRIGGVEVRPGHRATIDIPVARLYTHSEMNMPVHVIHGRREGPRLFVSAAIHGDEINGVEIIRRLLALKALNRLRGTLIAVPVVNVYGFIENTRYLPDRRDLNRYFPGSERGSLTSGLAHTFMEEIVNKCTHGIDIHTGANHRFNLPQVRGHLDDQETRRLAMAFGAPVILDTNIRDGSLRQAVMEQDIPMLLYEAGEVLRFDEIGIRAGVRGIVSVMGSIGMFPEKAVRKSRVEPRVANSSTWVRAGSSGILHTSVSVGEMVAEGAKIGEIVDPFGEEAVDVAAPVSGIVIARLRLPLVHQGDALFHLAIFDDSAATEDSIEQFQEELGPDLDAK